MDLDGLLQRYDVPGPRYTSYPTVPEWSDGFRAANHEERLRLAGERKDEPLSLYVHLPFCKSLCWYCGCNVVIARGSEKADLYLDHVVKELEQVAQLLGERRTVTQIHWGGGTPTALTEAQMTRLWTAINSRFRLLPGAEVAIEIHPSVTSDDQLRHLRALGFNRISMGLQDFDKEVQKATNRIQTVEQTAALLNLARELGFGGINFDLIYGLPHQTAERFERTVGQVLALRPDRIAVYSFAFMPEVLKHQKRLPAQFIPKGSEKLSLFRIARERFLGAGYSPIGMDHFALPTDELAVARAEHRLRRNFQGYTVTSATDVVAVGSSAISDVAGAYAQNVRQLSKYYERIEKGQLATERGLVLSEDDRRRRALIERLMCDFSAELGSADAYQPERERLLQMEDDGLIRFDGSRLEVTEPGQYFVRNVAMAFDSRLWTSGNRRFSRTV